MRFSFSAEQEEFRTSLRRALEARSPTKEVRRLMATDAGFEDAGVESASDSTFEVGESASAPTFDGLLCTASDSSNP